MGIPINIFMSVVKFYWDHYGDNNMTVMSATCVR